MRAIHDVKIRKHARNQNRALKKMKKIITEEEWITSNCCSKNEFHINIKEELCLDRATIDNAMDVKIPNK